MIRNGEGAIRDMLRQIWPVILGLSVFALSAVGIAAYMIASGEVDPVLAAGAVFLLAAGQVAIIIVAAVRAMQLEDSLSSQQAGIRALSDRLGETAARLERIEKVAAAPSVSRLDQITADIRALRDSLKNMVLPKPAPLPSQPPEAALPQQPHFAPPPRQRHPDPALPTTGWNSCSSPSSNWRPARRPITVLCSISPTTTATSSTMASSCKRPGRAA